MVCVVELGRVPDVVSLMVIRRLEGRGDKIVAEEGQKSVGVEGEDRGQTGNRGQTGSREPTGKRGPRTEDRQEDGQRTTRKHNPIAGDKRQRTEARAQGTDARWESDLFQPSAVCPALGRLTISVQLCVMIHK